MRDGFVHEMSFSRGIPDGPLTRRPASAADARGTTIHFYPDPLIFKGGVELQFDRLAGRIDELAYLNSGLTLWYVLIAT